MSTKDTPGTRSDALAGRSHFISIGWDDELARPSYQTCAAQTKTAPRRSRGGGAVRRIPFAGVTWPTR